MRLLVVLAHPDDETFICGGALAAFSRAGGDIHLVVATRGEHGRRLGRPPFATRETLPDLREQELRAACRALGIARLSLLGLRDKCLEFEDPDALAGRVAFHIRRDRPEALLTFHPERGGHSDHCAIGRAATAAWERAGDPLRYPEQLVSGLAPFQPGRLYRLSSAEVATHPGQHGHTPEQFTRVHVGAVAGAKLAAYRAHRSQTQLDAALWEEGEGPVSRMAGGTEWFEQVNPPFTAGESGLLGLAP